MVMQVTAIVPSSPELRAVVRLKRIVFLPGVS
jgi:hypothetical protein